MKENRETHYEILGVGSSASFSDIKKAFLELAKKFHPDKLNDKDLQQDDFGKITSAYRVLSDSVLRYVYDLERGIRPGEDSRPAAFLLEEPTVTGNAAADYFETLAGGIPFPELVRVKQGEYEFRGMDNPLLGKAYSAGLYSFGKLSSLAMGGYYLQGMKALSAKKFSSARFYFLEAVGLNPGNLCYRFALGASYEGLNLMREAAEEYSRVISLGGKKGYFCLPVREALINVLMNLRDYPGVKEQAREIMRRGLHSVSAEGALKLVKLFEKNKPELKNER